MRVSQDCVNLVKQLESFRAEPYLCQAGIPTIGYGTTHYADGTAVSLNDAPVTESQANDMMMAALNKTADTVTHYVLVTATQHQFDALCSFAYNLGTEALRTSTLLQMFNNGEPGPASMQFGRWVHVLGKVSAGLVNRRAAEMLLFLS